ncbi:hypothetical protein [Sphingomonas folli]|uniref:hypothetical protein n=1 Tax=Sphingomonas folli TaxID=2862497 RepID=UPI0021563441|nr:hypothetical protein [Sphingomonas folli]
MGQRPAGLLLSGDDGATWRATAGRPARAAGAASAILFAGAARRFYGLETDDAD